MGIEHGHGHRIANEFLSLPSLFLSLALALSLCLSCAIALCSPNTAEHTNLTTMGIRIRLHSASIRRLNAEWAHNRRFIAMIFPSQQQHGKLACEKNFQLLRPFNSIHFHNNDIPSMRIRYVRMCLCVSNAYWLPSSHEQNDKKKLFEFEI